MNRRNFLSMLGIGAAGLVVPSTKFIFDFGAHKNAYPEVFLSRGKLLELYGFIPFVNQDAYYYLNTRGMAVITGQEIYQNNANIYLKYLIENKIKKLNSSNKFNFGQRLICQ